MRRMGRVAKMGRSLARGIVFESLGPWSFRPTWQVWVAKSRPVRLMGKSWLAGPFHAWCRRDVERCCPVSSPQAGCPRVKIGRPGLSPGRQVSTLGLQLASEIS